MLHLNVLSVERDFTGTVTPDMTVNDINSDEYNRESQPVNPDRMN